MGSCSNWSQLLFLETFYIKTLAPEMNDGSLTSFIYGSLQGSDMEKKKHFVKIVTSLVTVFIKMTLYVYTLYLPKNPYFQPF